MHAALNRSRPAPAVAPRSRRPTHGMRPTSAAAAAGRRRGACCSSMLNARQRPAMVRFAERDGPELPAPGPTGVTGTGGANSVNEEQHPAEGMAVADNAAATPNSVVLGHSGGGDSGRDEGGTHGSDAAPAGGGEPKPAGSKAEGKGEQQADTTGSDRAAEAGAASPGNRLPGQPLMEEDFISDDWGPPA